MTNAYVVTGTLTDGRTLTLDEPLPAAGRVRVTVEVTEGGGQPTDTARGLANFLAELQRRRQEDGRVPPTDEEIDAYVRELKDD